MDKKVSSAKLPSERIGKICIQEMMKNKMDITHATVLAIIKYLDEQAGGHNGE